MRPLTRNKLFYIVVLLVLLAPGACGQGFVSYFTGDTSNVNTSSSYGICLMGGATEDDNAMKWFLNKSGGGDIVVIRVTGNNGYNTYLYSSLGITVNSVETIVIPSVSAANHPYVRRRVREAEGLFVAGGNQFDYVSHWQNTAVDSAINYLINVKKVPIGGTSAGMAIQGQAYFSAALGSITSAAALANPYASQITIGNNDFIHHKFLKRVITDSHYDNPDRRGRHTAFLARLFQDSSVASYGIACDEYTAVCVDSNGIAKVFGSFPQYDDNAYFIQPNCIAPVGPEVCTSGQPLTWNRSAQALKVYAIKGTTVGAGSFDLKNWQNASATGGAWEDWYVSSGTFSASTGAAPISCMTTEIKEYFKDVLTVYPNPGMDEIQFGDVCEKVVLREVNGKIIMTAYNVSVMNISKIPNGVYFVELSGGGMTDIKKLIKL